MLLPAGSGIAMLDLTINYLELARKADMPIAATGRVVYMERRTIHLLGELRDREDRLVAHRQ